MRLTSSDGVVIDADHLPARTGERDLAIVLAHGFTGSWRRPAVRMIAHNLAGTAGVIRFDFRGHGRSAGLSTVGDLEVYDLQAAVEWAWDLGYGSVASVGFSMGASIAVRHAALVGGLAAVVAVSGPSRWFYRGTHAMRRVHFAIERPLGRQYSKRFLDTRISPRRWDPVPGSPTELAERISPTPLLVVHGDRDPFFPIDHGQELYDAAREPKELWIEAGYGHAEAAATPELIERIGRWVASARSDPEIPSP